MIALLALLPSFAGGHYDPTEIARGSTLYASVSEEAGSAFRTQSARTEAMANALIQYETALDLLGERAPSAERVRLANLKKTFNREKAVLQEFAAAFLEDFDAEFSDAVARAAPSGAVPCQTMIPKGRALPGMPAPMMKNPECTGVDHTIAVISALDADPLVIQAAKEMNAVSWPTITMPADPQPTIGDSNRWLSVEPWFRGVMGSSLVAIDRSDEAKRIDIEAALEGQPDQAELESLRATAQTITSQTAAQRAEASSGVLVAVDQWNRKAAKKGRDVSWCANPVAFGGCSGTDETAGIGREIAQHKRIVSALP